jgi:hypothetical protein
MTRGLAAEQAMGVVGDVLRSLDANDIELT